MTAVMIRQAVSYFMLTMLGMASFLYLLYFSFSIKASVLEVTGFAFSIWGISLIRKHNILGWVAAAISNVSIGAFSIQSGVYGLAFLQLGFFFPTCLYALFSWYRGKEGSRSRPEWLSNTQRFYAFCFFALAFTAAFFIIKGNNALLHSFDVFALSSAMTAHLLMMLKKKECWLVFMPGNIVSAAIFMMVGGYLLSGLFIFYCINATLAFIQWNSKAPVQVL